MNVCLFGSALISGAGLHSAASAASTAKAPSSRRSLRHRHAGRDREHEEGQAHIAELQKNMAEGNRNSRNAAGDSSQTGSAQEDAEHDQRGSQADMELRSEAADHLQRDADDAQQDSDRPAEDAAGGWRQDGADDSKYALDNQIVIVFDLSSQRIIWFAARALPTSRGISLRCTTNEPGHRQCRGRTAASAAPPAKPRQARPRVLPHGRSPAKQ